MIFALVLFGAGVSVQIGGQDFTRMLYIRFKVSYIWRNVCKELWMWMAKDPCRMALYDKA